MKFVGFFGVSEKRLKGRKTRKIFSYVSFFRVVSELSEKEKNLRNPLPLRKSACREAAIIRILVQRFAKFQICRFALRLSLYVGTVALQRDFFLFPQRGPRHDSQQKSSRCLWHSKFKLSPFFRNCASKESSYSISA